MLGGRRGEFRSMRIGAEEDRGAAARKAELGALSADLAQELVVRFHSRNAKAAGHVSAREHSSTLF